jgi:hypothetical protein
VGANCKQMARFTLIIVTKLGASTICKNDAIRICNNDAMSMASYSLF